MNERIQVRIDRDLEDIVPVFLANREKDLPLIATLLAEEDYDALRVLGHRLKGAGGGYGFPYITQLGAEIENAAKEVDGEKIEQLCRDLEEYLGKVDVVYV